MANKYDDMVNDDHKTYTVLENNKVFLNTIDYFVENMGMSTKNGATK